MYNLHLLKVSGLDEVLGRSNATGDFRLDSEAALSYSRGVALHRVAYRIGYLLEREHFYNLVRFTE